MKDLMNGAGIIPALFFLICSPCTAEDSAYLLQLEAEAQGLDTPAQKPEGPSTAEQEFIEQINLSLDKSKRKKKWYLKQLEKEISTNSVVIIPPSSAQETPVLPEQDKSVPTKPPSISLNAFEQLIVRKKPTVYSFYNTLSVQQKKAVISEYEKHMNIKSTAILILDLYSDVIRNRTEH